MPPRGMGLDEDRVLRVVAESHALRLGHRRIEAERIAGDVVPVRRAGHDLETGARRRVEERRGRRADPAGERPALDRVSPDDRAAEAIAGPETDLAEGAPEFEHGAGPDDDPIEPSRRDRDVRRETVVRADLVARGPGPQLDHQRRLALRLVRGELRGDDGRRDLDLGRGPRSLAAGGQGGDDGLGRGLLVDGSPETRGTDAEDLAGPRAQVQGLGRLALQVLRDLLEGGRHVGRVHARPVRRAGPGERDPLADRRGLDLPGLRPLRQDEVGGDLVGHREGPHRVGVGRRRLHAGGIGSHRPHGRGGRIEQRALDRRGHAGRVDPDAVDLMPDHVARLRREDTRVERPASDRTAVGRQRVIEPSPVDAEDRWHRDRLDQQPEPGDRLGEARAVPADLRGAIDHRVVVDLPADLGVRDVGGADPRADRDLAVLERTEGGDERLTSVGRRQTTDVDTADAHARQDPVRIGLAEGDQPDQRRPRRPAWCRARICGHRVPVERPAGHGLPA